MSDLPPAGRLLDAPWQIALIVAPPGYGKTAAVLHWAEATPLPVVWHDLSGENDRVATWTGVVADARSAVGDPPARTTPPEHDGSGAPGLDDLLSDFAAERRRGTPVVVVFDRADENRDPAFWIDLDTLVERSGDGLRTVVIARSATAIPAGRWRASGRVLDIGIDELAHRPDVGTGAASDALDAILRDIEPVHRAAALRLAVPESFDSELAVVVAGAGAGQAALVLARHGLLERTADGADRRCFDPALRRLLVDELRRLDPAELRTLQFETAQHLARNGDLSSGYRILFEAGEADAAIPLAVEPTLELARAGDHAGVDRALAALPDPGTIDEPRLVVAIAATCLLCSRVGPAEAWVERLDQLELPDDEELSRRRRLVRAHLRLYHGDLEGAERELAGLDGPEQLPTMEHIALVGIGARVALGLGRPEQARRLLAEAPAGTSHRTLEREALTAWCELQEGDVRAAASRLDTLLAGLDPHVGRPDQTLLDATIAAAWACYLGGDAVAANRYAVTALADADRLRCDWNLLRAGAIAVTTLLRLSGPAAARSVLIETRLRRRGGPSPLDAELDEAEVAVLRSLGRLDAARSLLADMDDSPRARLLRASLEVAESGTLATAGLLDGSDGWLAPDRIVATLLTAAGDAVTLTSVVDEAGRLGLVAPLTGHGPAIDAALAALPLERLHPGLHQHLQAPPVVAPMPERAIAEALTARERTVLALLPSHLTYDQIAERLSLSVNTVKSNLKSIYRKLSVASRSDAVDAARAARLV